MNKVLAAVLVLSLGLNAWLLATGGAGARPEKVVRFIDAPVRPAGQGLPAGPAAAKEAVDLRARVEGLEKDLADAKEKASVAESLDPLALILYSRKPIGWKVRRLLEIEPEKDRQVASWKLAGALGEKEGSAREILEALRTESDAKVVALLGELLRAGAATKASPEDRRAFGELLRTGATPEVRTACVRGLFMSEAFRGGFDAKTKATGEEMNGILIAAMRTENSPEVVGAIARAFADWFPPPESMDALREAAARLPASPGRRSVWEAIGRGTFLGDQGASLVQEFQQATVQDVKDDIAAGLARAGNSMGGSMGGKPEDVRRKVEEARARFRTVYQGTSDAAVRRSLARASLYGMACFPGGPIQTDEQRADAGRFFRDLAALDPDATQRERLERVAQSFEAKGSGAYTDFDRILSGKE